MGRANRLFSDLKLVLALRALERADLPGEFLPRADRRMWSREAGIDGMPEKPGPGRVVRKLAERARIANGKRLPWSARPLLIGLAGTGVPGFVVFVVAAGAFLAGLVSLQFGESRAVNLLALPLVLLLGWNALIYLWLVLALIWRLVRKKRASKLASGVAGMWGARRALGRLRQERDDGSGAWRDSMAYAKRAVDAWREPFVAIAGPVLRPRLAAIFHLGAALWALGAVAGLFQQGWSTSYHAYWESTLLTADAARMWFANVFAPAASLFRLPLPLDQVAALQGLPTDAATPEATALPWFNLYAATLGLFIVAPRLILATSFYMASRWQLVLAIRAPLLRTYFEEVRYGASDGPESRCWTVAAAELETSLPAGAVELLEAWGTERELFNEVEIKTLPADLSPEQRNASMKGVDALYYGAERTPDDDVRAEIAFLREEAKDTATPKVVFLHAGRFQERFAGLPSAEDRWRERQAAWREAVGGDALGLVVIGETSPAPPPSAESPAVS